ncbi:retinol dehydrogenase 14-like [Branchiostoma lanceolatum]|uniref:retinol dehydrogenase 14-like n=1 Tax=Branchiostoma lanceolatum TaxID=7740 RepID=UPI003455F0E5
MAPSVHDLAVPAAVLGAGVALVLVRRFYFHPGICRSSRVMAGKTVLITGANSGIGKAAALELARRRARVILACRDVQKGQQAAAEIRKHTSDGELVVRQLDLASLASVRQFSAEVLREEPRLDVLINNAGVFQTPFLTTEDGFELQFGVNHLGHFLLTALLLDLLKRSAPSRVVVLSSQLYRRGKIDFHNLNGEIYYDRAAGYANSKLANNLFTHELARRLEGTGVTVNSVSPGMVWTNLGRHVHHPLWKKVLFAPLALFLLGTPWEGAQTVLHAAVAEELDGVSGRYLRRCKESPLDQAATDDGVAKKLWEVSEKLVGID